MGQHQNMGNGARRLDGFSSATEMIQALGQRQISAVALLELHLRRIERHNPLLNAIVTPNYEAARSAAAPADAARQQGQDAPLSGLPLAIKIASTSRGCRRQAVCQNAPRRSPQRMPLS